jgi:archaellum component FlaC
MKEVMITFTHGHQVLNGKYALNADGTQYVKCGNPDQFVAVDHFAIERVTLILCLGECMKLKNGGMYGVHEPKQVNEVKSVELNGKVMFIPKEIFDYMYGIDKELIDLKHNIKSLLSNTAFYGKYDAEVCNSAMGVLARSVGVTARTESVKSDVDGLQPTPSFIDCLYDEIARLWDVTNPGEEIPKELDCSLFVNETINKFNELNSLVESQEKVIKVAHKQIENMHATENNLVTFMRSVANCLNINTDKVNPLDSGDVKNLNADVNEAIIKSNMLLSKIRNIAEINNH